MFYAILPSKILKQGVFEFLIIITPYYTNLKKSIVMLLIQSLPQFFKCFIFGYEEIYLSEPREVIHSYIYILFSSNALYLHGSHQIHVDQF